MYETKSCINQNMGNYGLFVSFLRRKNLEHNQHCDKSRVFLWDVKYVGVDLLLQYSHVQAYLLIYTNFKLSYYIFIFNNFSIPFLWGLKLLNTDSLLQTGMGFVLILLTLWVSVNLNFIKILNFSFLQI